MGMVSVVDFTVRYWMSVFKLDTWDIKTERIDRNQVVFPRDIKKEEKFYVGIYCDRSTKEAVLYHDRELEEEDIIHELLHIKFPKISEKTIREFTRIIMDSYV